MTYRLILAPTARRALQQLPGAAATAIIEALMAIEDNPLRLGKELAPPWAGHRATRRAEYRIVYRVDTADGVIRVVRIEHRRTVYRRPT